MFAFDFSQVDFHRFAQVGVDQQIAVSASGCNSMVFRPVFTDDDTLVGNALEERKGQHQVLDIFHLIESRVFERFIPRCAGTVCSAYAGTIELHDGIVPVGVPECSGKYRPVGIAATVVVLPQGLAGIMQPLWNPFV